MWRCRPRQLYVFGLAWEILVAKIDIGLCGRCEFEYQSCGNGCLEACLLRGEDRVIFIFDTGSLISIRPKIVPEMVNARAQSSC